MKKNILLVIVTAIVFAGIGAFAAIQYQANEIGYGNGTVKDAIDDLYTKSSFGNATSSDILNNKTALVNGEQVTGSITTFTPSSSYTPTTSSQTISTSGKYVNGDITIEAIPALTITQAANENVYGDSSTRSLTKTLSSGKYIVSVSSTTSWGTNPNSHSEAGTGGNITIACSNDNCSMEKIAGYNQWGACSVKYDASNAFTAFLVHSMYYVTVSGTTTITATFPVSDSHQNPVLFSMEAAKIQ